MEFNNIVQKTAELTNKGEKSLISYRKPILVILGSVADITAGHGGSVADGSTPGTRHQI